MRLKIAFVSLPFLMHFVFAAEVCENAVKDILTIQGVKKTPPITNSYKTEDIVQNMTRAQDAWDEANKKAPKAADRWDRSELQCRFTSEEATRGPINHLKDWSDSCNQVRDQEDKVHHDYMKPYDDRIEEARKPLGVFNDEGRPDNKLPFDVIEDHGTDDNEKIRIYKKSDKTVAVEINSSLTTTLYRLDGQCDVAAIQYYRKTNSGAKDLSMIVTAAVCADHSWEAGPDTKKFGALGGYAGFGDLTKHRAREVRHVCAGNYKVLRPVSRITDSTAAPAPDIPKSDSTP
jgi:hypothetical protein